MPMKKEQKSSYKLLKFKEIKMRRIGEKIKVGRRRLHLLAHNSSILFFYRYLGEHPEGTKCDSHCLWGKGKDSLFFMTLASEF